MSNIEKIKAEIERLKGICTAQIKANPGQTFPFVMEMTGYDKLLSFIDSLPEEKPSEDLEEAAIDFADNARKQLYSKDYAISSIADYDHGCIDGFKAGAEWQKEQMMKEAVEGFVATHLTSEGTKVTVNSGYLPKEMCIKSGDKVRIIIVKED